MTPHVIRARRPAGPARALRVMDDPERLAAHLTDAAHFTGGHAAGLVAPETEADVAEVLRNATAVLPIGAQSSLTGGATPTGELLVSTARLNLIGPVSGGTVTAGAGVTLTALAEALGARAYYPPVPTFTGAFVGGTVATNAGGAATFKYGTTRAWVQALTIVLPDGDVLDVERGRFRAHRDGYFDLELAAGTIRVPIPRYAMPDVPKLSAGYFAAPGMDLIDLFIGAEGTLGIVTSVTLRILPSRPEWCLAFVPFKHRSTGIEFVRRLRDVSRQTWAVNDRDGVDVSGIEHIDARSLALLREDGADRLSGVPLPADANLALLITLDLPPGTDASAAYDQLGRAGQSDAPDTPLVRFWNMLATAGVVDDVEIAVPGDRARARQLLELREAVPSGVNARVARAKAAVDPRIEKTAADMIVPFDRFEEMLDAYDAEFRRRGLDAAVWGHISDGNVHPNVIPRSFGEVESGREAILQFGRIVTRLGGAPLAEHGVGRSRVKQLLLRDLYGDAGLQDMRRVKRAIDPGWKMAPGVLFSKG